MAPSEKKDKGFNPPNYTQTPNTLFDLLPVISNAELRITLTLIRETHGWHRQKTDQLSIADLASMSGLSESSAKTGLKEGQQRGTIRRFKFRDEKNRATFKYGLVVTRGTNFEEFERPRKTPVNTDQDGPGEGLPSQNLTGSEINPVSVSPGQILTPASEEVPSQILTTSYKEERNPIVVKEKERGTAATPHSLEHTEESVVQEKAQEQAADAAPPTGADLNLPQPPQDQPAVQASQNGQATSSQKVAGGGAAARREKPQTTEEYLRRLLSPQFVDNLLIEIQPLGVDRGVDWFALPMKRAEELVAEAQRTHVDRGLKVPTRLKELLDDECRNLNLKKFQKVDEFASADDDDEVDMDALIRSVSLHGTTRRNR